MATLKEKYSGKKGAHYFMLLQLNKIKNPFGCYFKITEEDFVTDLLEIGVKLQHFLDIFRPISKEVEFSDIDGGYDTINLRASIPRVYVCEKLKLRWSIRYAEPFFRYTNDKVRGGQFEPECDRHMLEFDSLTFHFEDKELFQEYLEKEIGNLKNDNKPKTGVFDGILFIKGKSFGNVGSPEREIRLKEIFSYEENKPFIYEWAELSSNTVYVWIRRANKSFFGGKKVIIKDGCRIFWTSKNLD